jgi:hypothetical protein
LIPIVEEQERKESTKGSWQGEERRRLAS